MMSCTRCQVIWTRRCRALHDAGCPPRHPKLILWIGCVNLVTSHWRTEHHCRSHRSRGGTNRGSRLNYRSHGLNHCGRCHCGRCHCGRCHCNRLRHTGRDLSGHALGKAFPFKNTSATSEDGNHCDVCEVSQLQNTSIHRGCMVMNAKWHIHIITTLYIIKINQTCVSSSWPIVTIESIASHISWWQGCTSRTNAQSASFSAIHRVLRIFVQHKLLVVE